MKTNMSWGDRFALIDHYKPEDTAVCAAFGLSQDELDIARTLRSSGTISSSQSTLDVAKYSQVFSTPAATLTTQPAVATTTKKGNATTHTRPETASKKVKEPQKRGRKGDKIARALAAVPTTQVPVETFMTQHGVSLAVLRQSKRFIEKLDAATQATIGKINVRQDKASKQLMIWREQA